MVLYWSVPAAVALLQALMVGRYLSTAKPGTTRAVVSAVGPPRYICCQA